MVKQPEYSTIVQLQQTTNGGLCYIAYHPEIPDCIAQGDSPDEARRNLAEATQMLLEYLGEKGLPIPNPAPLGHSLRSKPKVEDDVHKISVELVPTF